MSSARRNGSGATGATAFDASRTTVLRDGAAGEDGVEPVPSPFVDEQAGWVSVPDAPFHGPGGAGRHFAEVSPTQEFKPVQSARTAGEGPDAGPSRQAASAGDPAARRSRRAAGPDGAPDAPSTPVTQSPGGGPARPLNPSKRVTSIARSIALHQWVRRLFAFILLDLAVGAALVGSFLWRCVRQLPSGGVDFWSRATSEAGRYVARDTHLWPGGDFWRQDLVVHMNGGETFHFPCADLLEFAVPVFAVLIVAEIVALAWGVFDTRRIRRKLKPLNDLALTAEAIGSAAASDPTFGIPRDAGGARDGSGGDVLDMGQLVTLEHAITSASVDSPQVSTGDKDLRSIEVALNTLLKRMQEAKLQQMRFVSDASHELRTPIAVLQGYVNMLDRWGKADPAVLDESIEALKAEVQHMQELVEQLLFLARGDSGRNTLQRTMLNLADVAAEVCDESAMIDPAHLYVIEPAGLAPDDPHYEMVGDLAMVKQSMRIIVQNAAKYSPAGTTVTIAVRGAGGEVSYSVQDEGMGMSEKDTAHIFERFYRADAARGERDGGKGGTGLGLAIAKWIVDAHEGTIEVVSREGVGTRFTVRFAAA